MTEQREQQLKELFQQERPVSPSARRGLDRGYEQIRRQCQKQENAMKKRVKRPARLLVLAAVLAAMVLGAGAIVLHTGFFRTAFGDGVEDIRVIEETWDFTDEDGETQTHHSEYPAQERVAVDEAAAEEQVGEYVADASADATAQIFGYTVTVESYLVDENGIGVLTYTLENPEGLDCLDTSTSQVCFKSWELDQPGSGMFGPYFEFNGGFNTLSSNTYLDSARSTDTKAYLVEYFAPLESGLVPQTIEMHLSGYTVEEGAYFDEETSEDVGLTLYDDMEILSLPITELVPAREYRDEETGFTASLSQLGMKMDAGDWIAFLDLPDGGSYTRKYMKDGREIEQVIGPEWIDSGIELVFSDGERATLKADGVHNTPVETKESDYGTVIWASFNRLITQEVSSIELDVVLSSYEANSELDVHLSLTPAE